LRNCLESPSSNLYYRETLEEEKETDEKLTELSKEINLEANGETETGEESEESVETPDRQRTAKRKTGRAA
jgi:hypothetical protein